MLGIFVRIGRSRIDELLRTVGDHRQHIFELQVCRCQAGKAGRNSRDIFERQNQKSDDGYGYSVEN